MHLGQEKPRGIHVGAGDMRVNVDGAGHDDHARRIVGRVGACACRRSLDDASVANPEVADLVAAAASGR